ncbi:hypothetical protein [Sporosarcina sp. FSL K6-1508]|uniref:hypothetical protein n=1 Tax=Sporosarcina sp. FSL K6-1508 TaxID=2921553 RepID=UPI0030F7D916
MSEFRIIEIANEEAVKVFPEFEGINPSYICVLAKKATNEVIYRYSLDSVESETEIRELLFKYLRDFRKLTNLR